MRNVALDLLLEKLELVHSLFAVHDQRVALSVGVKPDSLSEVFHGGEVLNPVGVDRTQKQVAFDVTHHVGSERGFHVFIDALGVFEQLGLDGVRVGSSEVVVVEELVRRRKHRADFGYERVEVPVRRTAVAERGGDDLADLVGQHVLDVGLEVGAGQYLVAFPVDDPALGVDYIVVLHEMLAHVEVVGFDLDLRVFYRLVNHAVVNGNVVFETGPVHDRADFVSAEPAHQLIVEGDVELSRTGVSLASGASPELVVDAARLVTLGADDVEPSNVQNVSMVGLPLAGRRAVGVRTSSKHNIGASTRHVGGDGDRAGLAGLGHYGRFPLMLLGIEDLVRNPLPVEHVAEQLRLVDVGGADEDGLSGTVPAFNLADDGAVLRLLVAID